MAADYVASAALKATLGLTGETFADPDIATAITAASRGIDQLCGRRFWLDADANQVRYYTPVSQDLVSIDDLATLTGLAQSPGGDNTYNEVWALNTDFVLQPDNAPADGLPWEMLVRHPLARFRFVAQYPRTVQVTGRFGWPAIPAPIVEATSILATKLLRRSREAPFGIVSIGLDGAAVRIARNDPDIAFLTSGLIRGGRGFA